MAHLTQKRQVKLTVNQLKNLLKDKITIDGDMYFQFEGNYHVKLDNSIVIIFDGKMKNDLNHPKPRNKKIK